MVIRLKESCMAPPVILLFITVEGERGATGHNHNACWEITTLKRTNSTVKVSLKDSRFQ